ncbi:MAG: T9SS type A sorting domain-containing protein [Bacteroidota bacterium]
MTWHKKIVVVSLFFWFLTVGGHSKASPAVINNLDSVLFDLSQAAYSSNTVEFPVYFNSDDTINAVDFALRFNQANLTLDTLIDLSVGLQSTYFLNPGDSVLRFSSYNLSVIPNLTNVVLVRMFISSSSIAISDLYDFDAFLNGFRCSWRVFDGTNSVSDELQHQLFTVHPTPADGILHIESSSSGNYEILDMAGRIEVQGLIGAHESRIQDVSTLKTGIHTVRFHSSKRTYSRKILISH